MSGVAMRVLVHLGLNKCASTFVQQALAKAAPALRRTGVAYRGAGTHGCQYGLSRHYGFGPDAPEVLTTSVAEVLDEAQAANCDRVILSSEYLSLYKPNAAAKLVEDLRRYGATTEYVLFSRPLLGWIAALFNQYVKTVDQKATFPNINGFVDQVLRNRAVDIARRYHMWAGLVGERAITHYRLTGLAAQNGIHAPFEQFAGQTICEAHPARVNCSLNPGQVHSIGLLRERPPCTERDREITRILMGGAGHSAAPDDYLVITPDRLERLRSEIETPYLALPWTSLPTRDPQRSNQALGKAGFNGPCSLTQARPESGGISAEMQRDANTTLDTTQTAA